MSIRLARSTIALFGVSAMAIAAMFAVPHLIADNLERACRLDEWSNQTSCRNQLVNEGRSAKVARYKAGIAANPGDISNYILLSTALSENSTRTSETGESTRVKGGKVGGDVVVDSRSRPASLSRLESEATAAAFALAPQDLQLLQVRTRRALDSQDWGLATRLLVGLVEHYKDADAAKVLVMLLVQNKGLNEMTSELKPQTNWLGRVVAQWALANISGDAIVPLVLPAIDKHAINLRALYEVIRVLKAQGDTRTAYALWLKTQPQPVSIVFNGDFDNSLRNSGFGWEVPNAPSSRSGVNIRLTRMRERGGILELELNGKAMRSSPLKQTLMLPEGRYLLRGQYMTEKLNAEKGLVWALRCGSEKSLVGKTPPMLDTVRQWQPFSAEFDMPARCGGVVELQLESEAAFEMEVGFKGTVSLDGISIELISATPVPRT